MVNLLVKRNLQALGSLEEIIQLMLIQADAPLVDEFEDIAEIFCRDAPEVQHDWREEGVRGEGGLLYKHVPQDGRGGGEDDLVI